MNLIPEPDYYVKESKRAKHVTLRIKAGKGLLIVTPAGFPRKQIPGILKQKQHWLKRHASQIDAARQQAYELPDFIQLPAIAQEWRLLYNETPSGIRTRVISDNVKNELYISSPMDDTDAIYASLRKWIRQQAQSELLSWLDDVSQIINLPYGKGSIRNQESRWGSCSANGNIQLNQKLLFLPEELVHYILVHELCHTVHMNHSKAFWQLVRQFEPEYKKHENEVRHHAWRKYVPHWA